MSTSFPTSKQTFTDPNAGDFLNSPSHSALHTDKNDTIEAIQDKIGYTGSENFVLVAGDTMTGALTLANIANPIIQQYDNGAWGTNTKKLTIQAGKDGASDEVMIFDAKQVNTAGADSYTKLLLHCNGTDGSTTFTDSGVTGHTVTANDNAQVDTAQKKFGTGSALFDGISDSLSVPASADFDVGSGNFTVDFWFYPTSATRGALFAFDTDCHYGLDFHNQGTRNICLWASSNGSSWDLINADPGGSGIGSVSISLDTWSHIAIVRNGNNWRTYINGVKDIDITVSGTVTDSSAETFYIGRWGYAGNHFWFVGQIDEFRFSKGIARWTDNFTPETSEYPSAGIMTGTVKIYNSSPLDELILDVYGDIRGGKTIGKIALTPSVTDSASAVAHTLDTENALSTSGAKLMSVKNNGTEKFGLTKDGIPVISQNSTGAGTPLWGTNCPASTLTAPYTWIKMISSDGSTVYVPAWK